VERTADVQYEATRTLEELQDTLTSMRSLLDTLQRHPEALIQGKPEPEGRKN
jgi:paraquat-inducible protein B